jgi:hypothetical protein
MQMIDVVGIMPLRILTILALSSFLGCSFAAEDESLPALESLSGTVTELNEWVEDAELHVVLSWHIMTPEGINDSYFANNYVELDVDTENDDVSFELYIENPPPERAHISPEALEIEADEDDWLALGFLSVFESNEDRSELDWSQVSGASIYEPYDTNALLWGGSNTYLVAYWSGSEPLAGDQLHLQGNDLEPGLNLIRLFEEEEESGIIEDWDTATDLDGVTSWKPSYEICRWQGLGETTDLWSDEEDYPESHPAPDEVLCGECGSIYELENCDVLFEVLCSNCKVERVWVKEEAPDEDWPCFLEGIECTEDLDEPQCVLNERYTCIGDVWTATHDCSSSDDCCESGCIQID